MELSIACFLWFLMAKHRATAPELLLLVVKQPVTQSSPDNSSGGLRAQRQAVAITIIESVHLLLNDIGRLTDRAPIEFGSLQHGDPDTMVPVGIENGRRGRFHSHPTGILLRQDVIHSADGLDPIHHGASVSGLEDHESCEVTLAALRGNRIGVLIDQQFDAVSVAEVEGQWWRRGESSPRSRATEPIE